MATAIGEAIAIVLGQLKMIHANFRAEAAAGGLTAAEQDHLARRAFLTRVSLRERRKRSRGTMWRYPDLAG